MPILKKYGDWQDIAVRQTSSGVHYLLQMSIRENGEKKFRNRMIDAGKFPYLLFHGNQDITEKILK